VNELQGLLESAQKSAGDTVAWTAKVILPMDYDHTKIERKPDQWQPEYTLKRYFEGKKNGS
jgi:hypothetical protein